MISFDPFSPLSTLGENNAATDNQSIADNYQTFLTLLTTQLQNQNPLDPLDTNQFTSQLVEFAGVEQAVKTNDNLESLAKLSAANAITGAVSFIGKQVAAAGTSSELRDGSASWVYSLDQDATQLTVKVLDESGNQVFAQTTSNPLKEGIFVWDGRTNDGGTAEEGTYTISLEATAADGSGVTSSTNFTGTVTQVDLEGGTPVLTVGNRSVKIEDIVKILDSSQTTS